MGIEKKYDAVIAGYTCIDLTPEIRKTGSSSLEEIFRPGKLTEVEGISLVPGGVVPNTGMALKKFNKSVYLNGLIGDDFIGRALTDWLDKYGISEGIKIAGQEGTAFSIVIAPSGVDRIFFESTGCNKIFSLDHINFEAVSHSNLFHFGYPPLLKQFYSETGSQMKDMFEKVQKAGTVTSLDFSLPDPDSESGRLDWREILKHSLPHVDICAPSLEEACQIIIPEEYARFQSGQDQPDMIDQIPLGMIREIGKEILSFGAKILLIKAAHRGSYLLTGDISSISDRLDNGLDVKEWSHRELFCNAYPADPSKVVNATGAGDTAIAAFLSAILDGLGPNNSLQYANMAGRNNLYCNNIIEELDNWEAMTKEIESQPDPEIIDLGNKKTG